MAQCLYLSKIARLDLQTSIAFYYTMVLSLDEDDDSKLASTIRYLIATRHLRLILKVDKNGIVEWWVDVSFAVCEDMHSRTGVHLSLGVGAIYSFSLKQKINTISSTETELVGVADDMSNILWYKYFMEA